MHFSPRQNRNNNNTSSDEEKVFGPSGSSTHRADTSSVAQKLPTMPTFQESGSLGKSPSSSVSLEQGSEPCFPSHIFSKPKVEDLSQRSPKDAWNIAAIQKSHRPSWRIQEGLEDLVLGVMMMFLRFAASTAFLSGKVATNSPPNTFCYRNSPLWRVKAMLMIVTTLP